jgi:hypothetical protein
MVSFKADSALADLLEALPNRSDFIRRAVLAHARRLCPLCRGGGVLSEKDRREFELLMQQAAEVRCRSCGEDFPWVFAAGPDKTHLSHEDRDRIRTVMLSGDFFCRDCFRETVECDSCGVHLTQSALPPHRRKCGSG